VTARSKPDGDQWNPWAQPAFVATYERWADPHSTELARIALDTTGIEPGSRVLDVGSGVGGLAVLAAERKCSVLAFDSSALMVQRTNARLTGFADARAVQMDARAFDLDDDSFDAAFAVFSVTLIPCRDAALREMVRVVRPGGIVCLINWATPHGHPMFEIVRQAMAQLDVLPPGGTDRQIAPLEEGELLEAGCVDVSVEPIGVPARLPAPSDFFAELSPIFQTIPGFSDLQPSQLAEVESLIAHRVDRGGRWNWNLEAALGIGHVATT
jgi:ubiquinone/menaquinone biosynthesis C-methylase UbiE